MQVGVGADAAEAEETLPISCFLLSGFYGLGFAFSLGDWSLQLLAGFDAAF